MRPSQFLDLKRNAIRAATRRFRASNPRVFGSVLYGTDSEASDLDLLVDAEPGATLFDLGGLQDELESLLGLRVDLLTPEDLPPKVRAQVLGRRSRYDGKPVVGLNRSHGAGSDGRLYLRLRAGKRGFSC